MGYDFSGYATKNDLMCSDGRTIKSGAFKAQDGQKVPLVWRHKHDDLENILGHVLLENREDGVYAYAKFNDSDKAKEAKLRVEHEDINAMSIWANDLAQRGADVVHGVIREVSLVLAGANPGAKIDNMSFKHDDEFDDPEASGVIYTGLNLEHEQPSAPSKKTEEDDPEELEHEDVSEDTVEEIFETLSDRQKDLVYYLVGQANDVEHEDASDDDSDEDDETLKHEEEGSSMTRNVFEQDKATPAARPTLSHDQLKELFSDADKMGSLKDSFLAHAADYGITNIEELFPDAKLIRNAPDLVKRRTEWVTSVVDGASHSPFSRIKSMSADLTYDTARAKGYIKGNLKKEEFFNLQKRITTPTTIYKKQKLDRDDIIDITDLDVVAWLKGEMRLMLEEELGRAILLGDGREVTDEDKIKDPIGSSEGAGIRSIFNDSDFYAHQVTVPADVTPAALEELIIRSRPKYKGSGSPVFFTTEEYITDLLMQKDTTGRRIYKTEEEVAAALRVSRLVAVEAAESITNFVGIAVNMKDYTIGADNGGQTTFFDDFDIDYNQYKYLYEARLSGALTIPKSAIVFKKAAGA